MKLLRFTSILFITLTIASCSSLKVTSDYDTKTDFKEYKTFAFYKKGIDKANASDLDKKRILRAIEAELLAKGMTKSENPDILVSIFTKSREKVNVTSNMGMNPWGWGWNPWYYGPNQNVNVNQYTEGTLFIDFIDKDKNELVWQGVGSGALKRSSVEKREARIKVFVKEILEKYPPGSDKK